MTQTIHSSEPTAQVETRKQDHIRLALDPKNEACGLAGIEQIRLQHEAFPELNFSDISIGSERFGEIISTPFLVSSMTAGHAGAVNINAVLAQASEHQSWAMGVGSQRRQLYDNDAAKEWLKIRALAPSVTLFGNLGLAQLIQTPISDIERLIDSLQAQAMIIHTNPLQECLQPEGTPEFKGGIAALTNLCQHLSVPVIVKETGCGFSATTMKKLNDTGIAALDISGLGGTHWGRIEGHRSSAKSQLAIAAETFKNWGVSTVAGLQYAKKMALNYEIWASGGVRSGLDAAKLLALGGKTIGFAKPMLEAAVEGVDVVVKTMQTIEYELKTAMFCTGSRMLSDLPEKLYGLE